MKLGQHSYQKCPFVVFIVMYRNLYPKCSFRSCPYTVLVKCQVRFYRIFDEIGQNVDGKMYFYHKSHCSTTTTESNGSLFSSLAPANGYAQKNCAERFSAPGGRGQLHPRSQSLRSFGQRLDRSTIKKKRWGSGDENGSTSAFRNRIACPDDAGHRDVTSCKTREV